jgi:hypothetical protein
VDKLKAIIVAERCRKRKNVLLEQKMRQWEETHG